MLVEEEEVLIPIIIPLLSERQVQGERVEAVMVVDKMLQVLLDRQTRVEVEVDLVIRPFLEAPAVQAL